MDIDVLWNHINNRNVCLYTKSFPTPACIQVDPSISDTQQTSEPRAHLRLRVIQISFSNCYFLSWLLQTVRGEKNPKNQMNKQNPHQRTPPQTSLI